METALHPVAATLAAFVALPGIYLLVLALAALAPSRRRRGIVKPHPLPRVAVVIPAHNEEILIRATVSSVLASRYPAELLDVHVIADHCQDGTARIAGEAGAAVAVRDGQAKRGKGHAIDWFLRSHRADLDTAGVIVILDADTLMDPGFIAEVSRVIGDGEAKAVQGYHGVSNLGCGWRADLCEAAFAVSHHLRALGRNALGGTAGLKGNGMAFAADLLLERGWPAHSLVEDLEFTLVLLEDGVRVRYVPEARVRAEMVTQAGAAARQRERWEGGRMAMVRAWSGRLWRGGWRRLDAALLEAWADLVFPPFGILAGGLAGVILAGHLLGWTGVAAAGWFSVAAMAAQVGLALWHRGVPRTVWKSLFRVPALILGKVPLYLRLVLRGPGGEWVRTRRNAEAVSPYLERGRAGRIRVATSGTGTGWWARNWPRVDRGAKRALDIVGASAAILVFSPLMILTALLIKLEDRGPVLFRQIRVGEGGRRFRVLKFRSMVRDAERLRLMLESRNHHGGDGVTFKMKQDPRITRVGRWIRKFSIDEMPQFFNVLRGEMSLVGPRPALPKEVACYTAEQLLRLTAKPGITCLWQIGGRANIDFEGQVRLDLDYIRSASVWQDLAILLKTVPAVIFARGAY
jgi:lipopolysaccharide/colanic/teichoic acid biosynthesis glycosyltransferase/glycosyltransferase involved in cell wall biosynthesis